MPTHEEISPGEVHPQLGDLHVVDVRSYDEFHGPLGRIRNAILVPLPDLANRVSELPKDLPLLLVCRSGKRSGMACELLVSRGFEAVINLGGGMIAWNTAELPVEQTKPDSLAALMRFITGWLAQVSPLTPDAATELLFERCALLGASFEEPDHHAVAQVLDFVENFLTDLGAPPDLDLSIASFRRSLATL